MSINELTLTPYSPITRMVLKTKGLRNGFHLND